MGSKLDAKHEKQLKGLLRLPNNKKCANCETLSPQYVVTDFNIFVCTICSGVHRHFNHRVKGVTMATFKPEEMTAIEQGGNAVALAKYLARWTSDALPRPIDRSFAKVSAWIEAVWVKKQFWSDVKVAPQSIARLSSARSTVSEDDIPVRPADSLVRLQVGVPQHPLGVQSSAGSTSSQGSAIRVATPATPNLLDLLDDPLPAPAPQPPPIAPGAANNGWAAFGDLPAVAPAPAPASMDSSWAAFPASAPTALPAAAPAPVPTPAPSNPAPAVAPVAAGAGAGWASFDPPVPAASTSQPTAAPAVISETQHAMPSASTSSAPAGWQAFGDAGVSGAAVTAPVGAAPNDAPKGPAPALRQELPSDLFSEIRAPPAAPSFPSYPMGAYASGPQQYLNPSYPGAANVFPGQRPELPSGLPAAAAAGSAAFPAFSGMQQYNPQAGASAVPQGSTPVFPMANGAMVPPVPPQPAGKLASSDGPPDPFSMLVPGLKAALPTAATAPPPQGFSSFAPGSAPGLESGFGSITHAQIPINGQIPALHATAHVGFGAPSGASAPGAKSGNPFA
eukprot:jgi/Botrbrau1/10779/Bobra.0119s0005.2